MFPSNLCHCEPQKTIRGNYFTYQIVNLLLLGIQLAFIAYTQHDVRGYAHQYGNYQSECYKQLSDAQQQQVESTYEGVQTLTTLNKIFMELFMGNYIILLLFLIFFQLLQFDTKCCVQDKYRITRRVICWFKFRLIVRLGLQGLILAILILIGLQCATILKDLQLNLIIQCDYTSSQGLKDSFKNNIYYPSLINICFFAFATIVDNLLYFLKGCILQNLEWGSYHHEADDGEKANFVVVPSEIPSPNRNEKAYSFARQSSDRIETSSSAWAYIQSKSPNFQQVEMAKSNNGSQNSLS